MGMQIMNNIAALNGWRNLGVSNAGLSKSLEKLSSGYRINRGSDDPAGLLISEKLRAQIGGLDQAVKNASDAISMVQTAEGALTEMNNMLNSIRSLAVHAANTGSNDTAAIAADQTAVDKAVTSIQRIATTTKFAGKSLLDGTSTGATITAVATGVTVTATGTPTSAALTAANSGYQDLEVNTAASYGVV
ncbi:MAG: flagellin, partial [Candidatus Margulisiibacteriota bacterium]